jgi:hypothetical protein
MVSPPPCTFLRVGAPDVDTYGMSDRGQSYDSGLDVVLQTQLTVDDQLCILKFFEISTEGAPPWHPKR